MGLDELYGKRVAIDSAPLIYFVERRLPFLEWLREFYRSVESGRSQLIASTITLLEVLVVPIRNGDDALAQQYLDILQNSANCELIPVSATIAQVAAELRAEHRLKTADSIQLATAISHNADVFLTNDRDFGTVANLRVLQLSELVP